MSAAASRLVERAVNGSPNPKTARSKAGPTLDEIRGWPATVDVTTANDAAGVSRAHGYDLIARGEYPFKTLTVGGRIRVITASIIKVLSADDP